MRHLEDAATDADGETRKAVESLSEEVQSLHSKIDGKLEDVPSRLDNLWRRVKAVSERTVEHLATTWQDFGPNSDFKADLIEAKLHLSYADIDRFTALDANQAQEELGYALDYLDRALEEAPADKVPQLAAVRDDIRALAVEGSPEQQESRFAELRLRLGHLIRAL
jgi:hypothetical protein